MKKYGSASLLTIIVCVLAVVARVLYDKVSNTDVIVTYLLYGVIGVAVVGLILVQFLPRVANYIPIVLAALMASVAVWATGPMVNQLGWVVAGLDEFSVLMPYIYFMACAVLGLLVSIIAAFLPMSRRVEQAA